MLSHLSQYMSHLSQYKLGKNFPTGTRFPLSYAGLSHMSHLSHYFYKHLYRRERTGCIYARFIYMLQNNWDILGHWDNLMKSLKKTRFCILGHTGTQLGHTGTLGQAIPLLSLNL